MILRALNVDLVPFAMNDVDETYHRWLNDDNVVKYLEVAFSDRSLPALKTYIQNVLDNPNRYFYSIIVRDKKHRIGTASFEINQLHLTATWGYLIGEVGEWGSGAALEAQVAIFDHAFDSLGVRRFFGCAYSDNIASRFNLKRLGFTMEGTQRQHFLRDGMPIDMSCYGLLADEWRTKRESYDRFRMSIGSNANT